MTKHLKKISKYRPSALQGQLRFAAAQPRAALAVEHPLERVAFSVLTIALVGLIAAYLYFVAQSILNVMARREAIATSQNLEGSIGSLENQYFALEQTLTSQDAATLGLSPLTQTAYVERPGSTAVSQTGSDEI